MLGIYIHIPFCRQKCLYCDFPSFAGLEAYFKEYVNALCVEISHQGLNFSEHVVDTIYIGGGTPSLLPAEYIAQVIAQVFKSFSVTANAEISIEANPGTVDYNKLCIYKEAKINRISLGVQSFNDDLLFRIGRIHNTSDALKAVRIAKQAGFDNINIDLMYGLPLQDIDELANSFKTAFRLPVTHLSVYSLIVEEGTVLNCLYEQGKINLPDEDAVGEMYDLTCTFLPEQGFKRYEISNFCKQGFECRHNMKYWQYREYLGMGAASCSFIGGKRITNTRKVLDYIARINEGKNAVDDVEEIDIATQMAEYIFLGLRTVNGVDLDIFANRFGKDLLIYYANTIDKLTKQRLIAVTDKKIFLTSKGMKFGNIAFEAFLP